MSPPNAQPQASDPVLCEVRGAVQWITLNREEKRKRLRPDLVERYRDVDLGEKEAGDTPPAPKRDD